MKDFPRTCGPALPAGNSCAEVQRPSREQDELTYLRVVALHHRPAAGAGVARSHAGRHNERIRGSSLPGLRSGTSPVPRLPGRVLSCIARNPLGSHARSQTTERALSMLDQD